MSLNDVAQGIQIGIEITFTARRGVHFVVEVQWNLQQIEQLIRIGDVLVDEFADRTIDGW